MSFRKIFTTCKLILVSALFMGAAAPEWQPFQDEQFRLYSHIGRRQFDFLVWELEALWDKGEAAAANGQYLLTDSQRKEMVLSYLSLIAQSAQKAREIELVFADPDEPNPEEATAALQGEFDAIRAEIAGIQPIAEAILEEQVAAVLVEEGFGAAGGIFPPVLMKMTPLPAILILSPRDRIEQIDSVSLQAGLSLPAIEALEEGIYHDLDRSALVVPIGGVGIYPAMVFETSNVNWLADTIAHEWAHHWLTFRPLGISYAASPELRIINETVASLFGAEIGKKVIARYYPQFASDPTPPSEEDNPDLVEQPSDRFDFRAEMAETRIETDALLAAGKIDEAETYMEARRRIFVENGYQIRKLNQAYFAFYGAYADEPGATGSDPIGPAVVALREESDSIKAFMQSAAGVLSLSELEAMLHD